jgi:hypothetical protein
MYFNTKKTWSGRTNEWHTEEEWLHAVMQRFSTWGTRTPGGTQAGLRGYAGS